MSLNKGNNTDSISFVEKDIKNSLDFLNQTYSNDDDLQITNSLKCVKEPKIKGKR